MGYGYDRPWRVKKAWDQFAIPRPFTRARAIPSGEIFIPPNLDRDGIEYFRQKVENLLNRLTEEAEAWAEAGHEKDRADECRAARSAAEARRRTVLGTGGKCESRCIQRSPNCYSDVDFIVIRAYRVLHTFPPSAFITCLPMLLFDETPETPRPLSVGELTAQIKDLVEAGFPSVWVSGEISNFARPSSGHLYFTLKDDAAQLKAVHVARQRPARAVRSARRAWK